jgi:hypothetical protein
LEHGEDERRKTIVFVLYISAYVWDGKHAFRVGMIYGMRYGSPWLGMDAMLGK